CGGKRAPHLEEGAPVRETGRGRRGGGGVVDLLDPQHPPTAACRAPLRSGLACVRGGSPPTGGARRPTRAEPPPIRRRQGRGRGGHVRRLTSRACPARERRLGRAHRRGARERCTAAWPSSTPRPSASSTTPTPSSSWSPRSCRRRPPTSGSTW